MSRLRLLAATVVATVLLVPSAAGSGVTALVVSQLFGGGGNAGAPYTNDFVELFNSGSTTVDLSGWSIQYATAAGTSWQVTPLAGSVQPGAHQLVQLAGGAAGAALPTPDAIGTANMSAASGKVALVRDTTELACGETPGSCSAVGLVEDLVGYGTASDYEGSAPAPGLSSTTAAHRAQDGCRDDDANATDFAAAAPTPRNSAATPQPCGAVEPPPPRPPGAAQQAAVDVDVEPALSLSLERATLSFGRAAAGSGPAALSERVIVLSSHPAGYALAVQRSAFTPADLPFAIQATAAPAGGQLGPGLGNGSFVAVPIAPAAQTIGTTSAASQASGDVWPTSAGFLSPFPNVAPGRYTATVTFTVIGR